MSCAAAGRSRGWRSSRAVRASRSCAAACSRSAWRCRAISRFKDGFINASKVIAITPDNFPFILSVLILSAVVLGGSGNLPGVVLGAFMVAWLPERFRGFAQYRELVFGGALVVLMIFRPEGLLPSRRRREEMSEGQGGMGALGAETPTQ